MINVNKITSTLAKLPDQQLQQYARMHKNDPYIMALAMSESNRRKEMRAAGQGSMQEQPKVVDQMVAEMAPQQLPEDQGIGRLPAGNMNFADGGIIAFADGGDVERYNGMAGSLTGDIPGFVAGTGNFIPQAGAPEEVPLFRRWYREAQEKGKNYQLEQAKARIAAGVGTSADRAILAAAQPEQSNAPSPQDLAQFDAASNLYMTERANKQAAAAAPKVDAAPKADTTKRPLSGAQKAAPPALAATGAATQPETGGLDALMQNYTRQQDLARGAARNATVGYAGKLRDEAAKLVTDEEKRIAEKPDVYKDREARLLKQEKDAEGVGDKYLGLSLLQAGAAMMTTPGGIGMALGKGIQVGSERYIAGIDKINAAKEKFALAKDRLEDLRLSRADMNERDVRDAKKEARSLERQAEALFYSGAKDDLNMTDKQLTTLLGLAADNLSTDKKLAADAARTDKQIKSAEGIARLQAKTANRPGAEMQAVDRIMKEKKVPFTEALAIYNNTRRAPQTAEMLLKEWSGDLLLQQQYPNPKDYIKMMGGSTSGASQLSPADKALVEKYLR